MKSLKSRIMAAFMIPLLFAAVALLNSDYRVHAQAYPTNNPTYIPTGVVPAATLTATGDYYFNNQGHAGGSVRVSALTGTLVAAIQGSNDPAGVSNASANWTTLQELAVGGGSAPQASITANGLYVFNISGMTRFRVHVTTLSGGGATVTLNAAATPSPAFAYMINPNQVSTNGDPCQNTTILKKSAIINIGAATTTKIVDTSASTVIYVCGFTATLAGTTPTVVFKTGTHVTNDCDTGTTSLTGVFAPTSGILLTSPAGTDGTNFQSAAGGQLCGTTTGTGSSFQGVLTYVQQ